jgi:hypothetical protein
VVAPLFVFVVVVMLTHRLDGWSLATGAALATGMLFVIVVRDESPQHIQNWRRGAQGERKTERVLRPLERWGWTVEHDVQRGGRANLDHVVIGPAGVFLIETKNLAGTITVEDGVLVARQFDDPDEVYRFTTLALRVRGQAAEISGRIRASTGRRTWVRAVVVIWGHFPSARIEHDNVTYIRGDELREWLSSLPAKETSA